MWDAFKAVVRGECISAIKSAKKDQNQEGELLLAKEREDAKTHADSPSEASYVSLQETRHAVTLHFSNLAHTEIMVLLKPGKDPLECSSYHPIALLNMDLKMLTKVLATRLAGVLSTVVDIEQTGFLPGMSTDTNLRRLFTHLQLDTSGSPAKVVVSIDIEKTFESVDWLYMHKVLEVLVFGPGFRRWVTMLYSDPRTAIQLGIVVSDFFTIGRGTRQGCPLSPFIFALMMEPSARTLRQFGEVGGEQVGMIKECVALYADDLLLFLRDLLELPF